MFLEPILQSCAAVSDSKDQPELQFPCRNIFHCKIFLLVTFHRKIYLKARIEMNHFHPAHKTKYISKRNFSSENEKKNQYIIIIKYWVTCRSICTITLFIPV